MSDYTQKHNQTQTKPRFLTLKIRTWETIILVLVALFSSLILVEANRKNDLTPVAHADYSAPYPVDKDVRKVILSLTVIEFGQNQVEAMNNLLTHESNFNPQAVNRSSGACGIFQALPCNKMNSMDIQDQIQFGFNYIKNRYGTPKNAWRFWLSQTPHWY